jgi:hypothetical protein
MLTWAWPACCGCIAGTHEGVGCGVAAGAGAGGRRQLGDVAGQGSAAGGVGAAVGGWGVVAPVPPIRSAIAATCAAQVDVLA